MGFPKVRGPLILRNYHVGLYGALVAFEEPCQRAAKVAGRQPGCSQGLGPGSGARCFGFITGFGV